jgi:hypothetical protein
MNFARLASVSLRMTYTAVCYNLGSEYQALIQATNKMHHTAGNLYYNEKCAQVLYVWAAACLAALVQAGQTTKRVAL